VISSRTTASTTAWYYGSSSSATTTPATSSTSQKVPTTGTAFVHRAREAMVPILQGQLERAPPPLPARPPADGMVSRMANREQGALREPHSRLSPETALRQPVLLQVRPRSRSPLGVPGQCDSARTDPGPGAHDFKIITYDSLLENPHDGRLYIAARDNEGISILSDAFGTDNLFAYVDATQIEVSAALHAELSKKENWFSRDISLNAFHLERALPRLRIRK